MKKIDWLQYLKDEGFYETASPRLQEALDQLKTRQDDVRELETMLSDAGLTNLSPCPIGFAVECSTRIGANNLADIRVVFLTLLDTIAKLKRRIDTLENRRD